MPMNTTSRRWTHWIAPIVVTVFVSGPAFASASIPQERIPITQPAPRPPASQTAIPVAPAPATPPASSAGASGPTSLPTSSSDEKTYEAREGQSSGLDQWSGGASIYIGGSALAIALLIVLLIVLL